MSAVTPDGDGVPYDEGGPLPSGPPVAPETADPIRWLTPRQAASYDTAVKLVARWRGRDCRTVHLPDLPDSRESDAD